MKHKPYLSSPALSAEDALVYLTRGGESLKIFVPIEGRIHFCLMKVRRGVSLQIVS